MRHVIQATAYTFAPLLAPSWIVRGVGDTGGADVSSSFPCHSHVPDPRRVCLGGPDGTDTRLTRSFSSPPSAQPLAMPARISPDTDSSRIATVCAFHLVLSTLHYGKNRARDGICIGEQLWAGLSGQCDMQGILQRGQDRAISLLSLSSLF